jgi:D-sedoheptulose 7-phosphate isomerase
MAATDAPVAAGHTRERTVAADPLEVRARALVEQRATVVRPFFDGAAERVARLCLRMAERFARGGRLIAVGYSPAARSDVRHVAVEFVHPVIVGKRALPAIGITAGEGSLAAQLALLAEPPDIVLAFPADAHDPLESRAAAEPRAAVTIARDRGCLTVGFADCGAEWEFSPGGEDPFIAQEIVETLYHVLWELVHVFFEHKGLLEGSVGTRHDAGASRFLYPFLGREEHDVERVIADVRQSVLMKAEEVTALRIRAFGESGPAWCAAARTLRAAFDAGHTLLVCGNGGSATDAMDAAADYRFPPAGWTSRPTLDLTEDAAIITAIANDIGSDAIFARQFIAYGRRGDVAMMFTTSGSSRNLIQSLGEARRRGLATIAFVGYDGGEIAARALADHVIIVPSQYIPRIQEAQATAHHSIRELVEKA